MKYSGAVNICRENRTGVVSRVQKLNATLSAATNIEHLHSTKQFSSVRFRLSGF